MVYDSKRDRLLLFGGYGTDVLRRSLVLVADDARVDADQPSPGARPTARYGHWMFYDAVRDKVYVFGQNGSGYQNWEFDPALNTWQRPHGDVAARGRVAQLLRRHVRHARAARS